MLNTSYLTSRASVSDWVSASTLVRVLTRSHDGPPLSADRFVHEFLSAAASCIMEFRVAPYRTRCWTIAIQSHLH